MAYVLIDVDRNRPINGWLWCETTTGHYAVVRDGEEVFMRGNIALHVKPLLSEALH